MNSGDSLSCTETDFMHSVSNGGYGSDALSDPPQIDPFVLFDSLPSDLDPPESCPENLDAACNRGNASVTPPSEHNIVATWAEEFYRARDAKLLEQQCSVPISVDPPLRQGDLLSPQHSQQPPKDNHLPVALEKFNVKSNRPFRCDYCKTSYGTPARLKRHFNTKKHKTATDNVAASKGVLPIKTTTATPPSTATPPIQAPQWELLPDIPLIQEEYQSLSPVKLPQMQVPKFKTYSDIMNASIDPPIYSSHIDFQRSSQSPCVESHHTQNPLFPQHQPSPTVQYGNIPYSSLSNSHQSVHPSPPYPSATDRSQSFPTLYQQQTPPTWYPYPLTPYQSPNPYYQRYPEYSTVQGSYQKFETNNNVFLTDLDQRPFQQEALDLWIPNIANPEQDVTVVEVDAVSNDDSETMSPTNTPDSQQDPLFPSDCPLIPNIETPSPEPEQIWRCEQCHKEFITVCHLAQHYIIAHTVENPLTCDVCDKGFASEVDLMRHKYLHCTRGAKNFQCHLCPKSCDRKDQLLRHVKRHESHAEDLTKQFPG